MIMNKQNHRMAAGPATRTGMLLLAGLLLLAAAGLLTACMEPNDAELPVEKAAAGEQQVWERAGSFGGNAVLEIDSEDPWEIRYKPGGFKQIAGVCATADEVWVCDLAISRVQVFDFAGNHLRDIGSGVPLEGTLLTDEELFIEDRDFDPLYRDGVQRWEDTGGRRWRDGRTSLFKAGDVLVLDGGFLLADQAKTNLSRQAQRRSRLVMFRNDGTILEHGEGQCFWPSYLAMDGEHLALSETPGNSLWIGRITEEGWMWHNITREVDYRGMLRTNIEHSTEADYHVRMLYATHAGNKAGEYYGLGGIAYAFDKLIACDTGNQRLQVMEGRHKDRARWGRVVRVVPRIKDNGMIRFSAPLDIDITGQGWMYVLDSDRLEVAILNPNFDRTGSFGHGEMSVPLALDLSDDERHCFITDSRNNMVHHYVRSD